MIAAVSLRSTMLIAALLALASFAIAPPTAHGKTFRGHLIVGHGDDFAKGKSTPFAYLDMGHGRVLRIQPVKRPGAGASASARIANPHLSRAAATVEGRRRGDVIYATGLRTRSRARSSSPRPIPAGGLKTVVVPVKFDGTATPSAVGASLRERIFTDSTSASAYIRDASGGRNWLTGKNSPDGDVADWVSVPRRDPADRNPCPVDFWARKALAKNHLTGYDHYIFLMSKMPCNALGIAISDGKWSWLNGVGGLVSAKHELGHNLGFRHANSIKCRKPGTGTVALSDDCRSTEYGDPFDAMGSINGRAVSKRLYSTINRGDAGWLPGGTATISRDGTYTLAGSASNVGSPQALRIPRLGIGGAARNYLYLEYRRPSGIFDDFQASAPIVNGVTLRVSTPVDGGVNYGTEGTLLVDANPASSSRDDASLMPGRSLTDSVSGLTVRTDAVTPTAATVTVTGVATTPLASVTKAGYGLTISGSAGAINHLMLHQSGDALLVEDTGPSGAFAVNGCTQLAARKVSCSLDGLDWIKANLGDGNDSIMLDTDRPTEIHGDSGNDMLFGGRSRDVMKGGSGDDLLIGGLGDDFYEGESGHDTLREGWPLADGGNDDFRLRDDDQDTLNSCGVGDDYVEVDRDSIDTIGTACEQIVAPN